MKAQIIQNGSKVLKEFILPNGVNTADIKLVIIKECKAKVVKPKDAVVNRKIKKMYYHTPKQHFNFPDNQNTKIVHVKGNYSNKNYLEEYSL